MIQMYTKLKVTDNSGAKLAMYIRVLGKGNKKSAQVGDIIIVSIKKASPNSNIKKKTVAKAVIVRQTFPLKRSNGSTIRFDDNAVVLIDDEKNPKGTRVLGPIARELRSKGFSKIISLAPEVL